MDAPQPGSKDTEYSSDNRSGTVATRAGAARSSRSRGPAWFRRLRWIVEAGLVAAAGFAFYAQRHDLALAASLFGRLRWVLVGGAILAEAASMGAFARMQRWLLRVGGVNLDFIAMVEITLAGNALSVSLPGGVAWSTVWILEQLRRREAPRHLVVWVLVVTGVLSSVALGVLLIAGVWIAGARDPTGGLRWPFLGVGITVILFGGLAALRQRHRSGGAGNGSSRFLARFASEGRVRRTVDEALRYARAVDPRWQDWGAALFFALMNWIADAGCLVASMLALRIAIPWQGVLISYGVTQLAASIPLTPGGLGVVEGSLALMLVAYGLPLSEAVAATLLYRVISFWALVPIGWVTWGVLGLRQRGTLGARRSHRSHPWAAHGQDR